MKRRWQGVLRPQVLSGMASLCLCLLALYGFQRHTISSSVYQGAPPVITAAPTVRPSAVVRHQRPAVDCSLSDCLALTFDDGPSPATTPNVLNVLEQANAPATFFVIGSRVHGSEALLQRMYQDGDEIGNHSWNHPDLTKLPPGAVRQQVEMTQAAVMAAGVPAPRLFRPPYGAATAMVKSQVPLTLAMWNVDPEDWNTPDINKIVADIQAQARPGGVVVLHDIHAPTAQALAAVIENLKSRFELVTVSELFNLAPGQRGEYYGR